MITKESAAGPVVVMALDGAGWRHGVPRDGHSERSSDDLVHPIVLWVVTKRSKVNTTATTTAGALMRDATKCRLYTATQRLR